jgi:hypothetical protein
METKVRIVMKSLIHDLKINTYNLSDSDVAREQFRQLGAMMELIDRYVPNDAWIEDAELQKIYEPYIIENQ